MLFSNRLYCYLDMVGPTDQETGATKKAVFNIPRSQERGYVMLWGRGMWKKHEVGQEGEGRTVDKSCRKKQARQGKQI